MTEYGLIGFPLIHSFSRQFFSDKFREEGIDAQYLNFEMETVDGLRALIAEHPQLRGLNVTIPHKQNVMALLDEISDEAREIGAVNVIAINRGADGKARLKGHNADVVGFEDSIRPLLKPHHKRALVLGTGGASKAISYGLRRLGLEITPVSRTERPGALTYRQLTAEVMAEHTVVVNCTPLGTFPHEETYPDLPYGLLTERHLLYDLVYNPAKTQFLLRGEAQGAAIKNGLEMLHLQALASWEIWNK
jgi:shikimate dehydrogenase